MTNITPQQNEILIRDAHDKYKKELLSYALFRVNDASSSEDLIQCTYIKTWKYLVRGGHIKLMRAFLFHILKNPIIDEYRKHKTLSLDEMFEKGIEPSIDTQEEMQNMIDGQAATRLIDELPLLYKEVMSMKYIQNLTLHETAAALGLSRNTTAVRCYRGLAKLKILYNKESSQFAPPRFPLPLK